MTSYDNLCDNCGLALKKVKEPISVGAYAGRGTYCSPLCAHLCQPGWTSLSAAVKDVKGRVKKGKGFRMAIWSAQTEAAFEILIRLGLKEIKFLKTGKEIWRVEGKP